MRRVPPEDIRVTNTERENAAQRLIRAHTEGSLTIAEFDSRVAAAWSATTRGDLDTVLADLPSEPATRAADRALLERHRIDRGYRGPRGASTLWLLLSGLSMLIWGLSCVGVEHLVYPWCIWVVGPAGGALAALWFWLDTHANPNGHDA